MSSTNRGGQRHPDDFYRTPAMATLAILPHLTASPCTSRVRALDPACGDGAILDVVSQLWPPAMTIGYEIDEQRAGLAASGGHHVVQRDALSTDPWEADIIVANPPFSLAMEFIQRALATRIRGDVAFLLRLNFLGSQKRAAWHREHPSDVYILPKRPAFTPDGKTDSCEYAWFCWGHGRGNRWHVLDLEAA